MDGEVEVIETETIDILPTQTQGAMQMPSVSPLFLPFLLPFMLMQQMMAAMTQMSMPTMNSATPQQTIVKLGYDANGNITSVYERKW
jgi:hypothetical protein